MTRNTDHLKKPGRTIAALWSISGLLLALSAFSLAFQPQRVPDSTVRGANSGVTVEVKNVSLDFKDPLIDRKKAGAARTMSLELGISNKMNNSFYEISCPGDQMWLITDRVAKIPLLPRRKEALKPLRVPAGISSSFTFEFPVEGSFMSLDFMLVDTEWGNITLPLVSVGEKGSAVSPGFEFKPVTLSGFTFGIVSISRLRSPKGLAAIQGSTREALPGTTKNASFRGSVVRLSIRNGHLVPKVIDSRGLVFLGKTPDDLVEGKISGGPEISPAGPHGNCPGRGGDCPHILLLPGLAETFRFDFPGLNPDDPAVLLIKGDFGSILLNLERP